MAVSERYPTHEEIEVILQRARDLRAQYLAALLASAALRARQWTHTTRERRRLPTGRRFYPDVC